MSQASDYLENKLADHITGKTSYTKPTNVFIALCTAAVADNDTGTTITEAAYGAYARQSTAGADWNAASGGTSDNANAITFPEATSGSETETDVAACDALTAGNLLWFDVLTTSVAVTTGVTPKFNAGDLSVTVA